MKKVILNAPILGLNGETVVVGTGRMIPMDGVQSRPEQTPITFADLALRTVIQSRTQTDEDTEMLYDLAVKLNATSKAENPEVLELSDAEFDAVKKSIDREAVIVKYRFLEMLEVNNPA